MVVFRHNILRQAKNIFDWHFIIDTRTGLYLFRRRNTVLPVKFCSLRQISKYKIKSRIPCFFTFSCKKQLVVIRIFHISSRLITDLFLRGKDSHNSSVTGQIAWNSRIYILAQIGLLLHSVSNRQFISLRASQFLYVIVPQDQRSSNPTVSIRQFIIRISSYHICVCRILIVCFCMIIEILWRCCIPALAAIHDLTLFIVIDHSWCFRKGHKRSIAIFIRCRDCHQIICHINDSRFSVRMNNIRCCKQAIHSSF